MPETNVHFSAEFTKTDDIELTNANLGKLEIKGFQFFPSFKNNIYSYSLVINESIDKLNIFTEAENENAKIEIIGNENLKEGNNLIKIIVTAENEETTKEYKINV